MELQEQEHYCTLFNASFLPMGVAMIKSLLSVQFNSHVFVLCLDELTGEILKKIFPTSVVTIGISELEKQYSELLKVKKARTFGEYCWTLTPYINLYTIQNYNVNRITYLDADLFFFKNPQIFIEEMILHKKHVLITEHGYDPKYDQTKTSGKFCVQFVTFQNSPQGLEVLTWWKERCLEWCYNRFEDGKFGDQMYLDIWPDKFKYAVHILEMKHLILAPWNVKYYLKTNNEVPVFYHFHGFRLLSTKRVLLYNSYKIGRKAKFIYNIYLKKISEALNLIKGNEFYIQEKFPENKVSFSRKLRNFVKTLIGIYKEKNLSIIPISK